MAMHASRLRSGTWKLVHNGGIEANATAGPRDDNWELFDLDADPSEQRSVAQAHPELLQDLRRRLEQFRAEAAPAAIAPNTPPDGFEVPKVWGERDAD